MEFVIYPKSILLFFSTLCAAPKNWEQIQDQENVHKSDRNESSKKEKTPANKRTIPDHLE